MSAPPPVGVIALALMGCTTVMQGRVSSLALRQADAILSALAAAGYAVVPVEPNEAMAHAGGCASEPGVRMEGPMPSSKHKATTIYRAMLAAAKETQA